MNSMNYSHKTVITLTLCYVQQLVADVCASILCTFARADTCCTSLCRLCWNVQRSHWNLRLYNILHRHLGLRVATCPGTCRWSGTKNIEYNIDKLCHHCQSSTANVTLPNITLQQCWQILISVILVGGRHWRLVTCLLDSLFVDKPFCCQSVRRLGRIRWLLDFVD